MSKATICGAIRNLNVVETPGGSPMCIFDMDGASGMHPAIVFPSDFTSCGVLLKEGLQVQMHGLKPALERVARFIVTDISPWNQRVGLKKGGMSASIGAQ
jgi:hypothetical protein